MWFWKLTPIWYHSIFFNERIIAATWNFQGMLAKNDSLSQIKELVRIYPNSKYLKGATNSSTASISSVRSSLTNQHFWHRITWDMSSTGFISTQWVSVSFCSQNILLFWHCEQWRRHAGISRFYNEPVCVCGGGGVWCVITTFDGCVSLTQHGHFS